MSRVPSSSADKYLLSDEVLEIDLGGVVSMIVGELLVWLQSPYVSCAGARIAGRIAGMRCCSEFVERPAIALNESSR